MELSKERSKGTKFEAAVAEYMSLRTGDRIERRAMAGANDRGDLSGLEFRGKRVTVECKDCRKTELAKWIDEAEVERGNDDAEFGIVVHHRKGKGAAQFGENYVTMTLDTFLGMKCGSMRLLEDVDVR